MPWRASSRADLSTATGLRFESSKSNVESSSLQSVSLPMLGRWVVTVWVPGSEPSAWRRH